MQSVSRKLVYASLLLLSLDSHATDVDITPIIDRMDTLIFLTTSAAVGVCFIFGMVSWIIVVKAMKEKDF